MRGVSGFLALLGCLMLAAAAYFFRAAYNIDISVRAGEMVVANAALMHAQSLAANIAIGATICASVLFGSAGVAFLIERP